MEHVLLRWACSSEVVFARVVLAARSEDQLAAVTDEIREAGREADFDNAYNVNLKGVYLATVAEVATIRATTEFGAIVLERGQFQGNPELPA